jgi:effector-binding domain-containing protein
MRALKTILIILLTLLGLFVILGFIGPKSFRVERSLVIAAPVDVVFNRVSKLAEMKNWGPWQAMDKDQVQSIEGTDGTVGAVWKWEGDTVGKGMQEIVAIETNKSVRTKLTFLEPMEAVNESTYDLEDLGDSTRITWGLQGENDFLGRVMGLFKVMDRMIGPDFERGLSNLKGLAEADAQAIAARKARMVDGFEVNLIDRPTMWYLGERKRVKWSNLEAFFGQSFGKAMGILKAAGLEPAGPPTGLYFEWNEAKQEADVLAGIPVPASTMDRLIGTVLAEVPAGKAYTIDHYGPYANTGKAHEAMDKKLAADGATSLGVVLEEYITDPTMEPDTAKWLTRVVYPIK